MLYAPAASARARTCFGFFRATAAPAQCPTPASSPPHPPSYTATTPCHTARAQYACSAHTALPAAEGLYARWSGRASPCRRPLFSLAAWAHSLLPPSSSLTAKCYVLLIKSHGATAGSASIRKTYISRSRGRPRPGRLRKYNYYFHLFAAPPPSRILRVRARVRALYFSNTPAARHAVIACALYFVFFFFLLCAVFFSLQRLPATLRAEARRRACPPAACACCVRERQPALFRLLLLLLVVSLPLLACAAAAAAVKFCVQPTAAAFPLLLPARGQAFAGAGFFYQRVPTHAKNLVGTSPPASAISALAQPTRACAR